MFISIRRKAIQPVLYASLSAALLLAGCSKAPEPVEQAVTAPDPAKEGSRILRQMSTNLANAKAFSFETAESLERPGVDASGAYRFTRSVVLQRPGALRFELKDTEAPNIRITAHYDGQRVHLRNLSDASWTSTPSPGGIDAMLDDLAVRYSLPLPFADVAYSSPYDAFIGPSTQGGLAGKEIIDGKEYVRLEYADDVVGIRIWTEDSPQALPKRIELTYKTVPGTPKATIDFSAWNLQPAIDASTFTADAGQASSEIEFGAFIAGLLASSEGTSAPVAP